MRYRLPFVVLADPELLWARVERVGQISVAISWSPGRTRVINDTVVVYRDISLNSTWQTVRATRLADHTISSLQPGHTYEIYVALYSFDKAIESQVFTRTTGGPPFFEIVGGIYLLGRCRISGSGSRYGQNVEWHRTSLPNYHIQIVQNM